MYIHLFLMCISFISRFLNNCFCLSSFVIFRPEVKRPISRPRHKWVYKATLVLRGGKVQVDGNRVRYKGSDIEVMGFRARYRHWVSEWVSDVFFLALRFLLMLNINSDNNLSYLCNFFLLVMLFNYLTGNIIFIILSFPLFNGCF